MNHHAFLPLPPPPPHQQQMAFHYNNHYQPPSALDLQPLFEAVGRGDCQEVRDYLASYNFITVVNKKNNNSNNTAAMMTAFMTSHDLHGCMPLHVASLMGHTAMAELLLEFGADANARTLQTQTNVMSITPLHLACRNGCIALITLLIQRGGANVNDLTGPVGGITPLHIACERDNWAVLSCLLRHGANLEARCGSFGSTPLNLAVHSCRLSIIRRMIQDYGANVNATFVLANELLGTPLVMAVRRNRLNVVKYLVQHTDALLNDDSLEWSPLHWACQMNHGSIVSFLLEQGAHVNATLADGRTPLHLACAANHVDIVEMLLAHDTVDVNATLVQDGRSPLFLACEQQHAAVVEILLQHHHHHHHQGQHAVNVNLARHDGATPLILATTLNNLDMIQLLLEHGDINVNAAMPATGVTALYIACDNNHFDAANLLLVRHHASDGAIINVNITLHHTNETPLHAACRNNHWDIAKILVENGGNALARMRREEVHVADRRDDGDTPLSIACSSGKQSLDLIFVLLQNGIVPSLFPRGVVLA